MGTIRVVDPKKPVRILGVVTLASRSGRYGGPFDTRTRQLLIASRLGYDAHLAAGYARGDEATLTNPAISLEIAPVHSVLGNSDFQALFSWRMLATLHTQVRKSDIVHISLARELVPLSALFLARLYRKQLVLQPHGMLTSRTSALHRLIDHIIRPFIGKGVKMIALTEIESGQLRVWAGSRQPSISVIGNPLPEISNEGDAEGTASSDVLFVARLHRRKRVDTFIDAAACSAANEWNETYAIVGPDGGQIAAVRAAAEGALNLSYEGALSPEAVTNRVGRSRVFVLTSENEPWGNVLALALSLHKPVVISASTALAAQVERFAAGFVVPDGDASAFSRAIHSLTSNEAIYARAQEGAARLSEAILSRAAQEDQLREIYGAAAKRSDYQG